MLGERTWEADPADNAEAAPAAAVATKRLRFIVNMLASCGLRGSAPPDQKRNPDRPFGPFGRAGGHKMNGGFNPCALFPLRRECG